MTTWTRYVDKAVIVFIVYLTLRSVAKLSQKDFNKNNKLLKRKHTFA